ncbi:HK97 gp10 family phage protein [Sulfitobacter sp. M22]|uniref:HK97 gp10 family phage protein n=1 Tax=Sulfitobacter sp. M22 TaxID=2675332 RepID=UPI001F47E559|nr:HK97 gp10 family phage protein [Sulfitobacter sp. M22]MCF7725777.1 hypothetical protein [Sulfitobacter sp. M22]
MTGSVKLTGFKELDDALKDLTAAGGKGALRRALKTAAQPIAEAANAAAPVGETGEYAQSFSYSTKLNKRQSGLHRKMFRDDRASVEGFIGTDNPAGVQQEFGNENHGPQPALRPAWDGGKDKLLDDLGREIGSEINKATARAARKAARQARG